MTAMTMVPELFTTNSSFFKTKNVQLRKPKVVEEKAWNFVYDGNIYFFRFLRFFGLFPVVRNKKGK